MIRRILLVLVVIYSTTVESSSRFSPFRSAFRISSGGGQASARTDDSYELLTDGHNTVLPSSVVKSKSTTPFNMETTKKKIISTLLSMTENEISKKLNQLDSSLENNEVLSSNNKRFKSDPLTAFSTEKSDSATSSLFELSTEASNKQTTTTAKSRKVVKVVATTSSMDAAAMAEAAAAAIASMHSMHFSANKNVNRVVNTQTSKIPVHHHNPYNDFSHEKINFDVNYRPTSEAPIAQPASSSPTKKSSNKNRESVKNLINGLVNFVSSPLFNQAKPLIASTYSSVSNAFSSNKNAIGSLSSSSSSSASSSALNASVLSKMFNSLRTFAILRRNEANGNKNSKKKGKLNSAVNNSSSSNNNLSNQSSFLINLFESFLKTREALLSGALVPNKSNKPVKLSSSSNNKNTLNNVKPSYSNALNLLKILWKAPALKQEARSI